MIGISNVGTYIPEDYQDNMDLLNKFDTDEEFIREKIGVLKRAIKKPEQKASDLCVLAFKDLQVKANINLSEIECCVVVTQNPDFNIPHTSAIVHGALKLPENCACFDISLGCSGYVYALSIAISFMQANNMKKGLIFTADPYSDIIDNEDKNTALIFGDASTVTMLEEGANLVPIGFDFGTNGSGYKNLINEKNLYMNGRAVFNFTASKVPEAIHKLLKRYEYDLSDIDKWYFHQGSKYIVDTIVKRLDLNEKKVPFDMYMYGNTVSSSIPLLLVNDINSFKSDEIICMSGFGVGLSWASAIFKYC